MRRMSSVCLSVLKHVIAQNGRHNFDLFDGSAHYPEAEWQELLARKLITNPTCHQCGPDKCLSHGLPTTLGLVAASLGTILTTEV